MMKNLNPHFLMPVLAALSLQFAASNAAYCAEPDSTIVVSRTEVGDIDRYVQLSLNAPENTRNRRTSTPDDLARLSADYRPFSGGIFDLLNTVLISVADLPLQEGSTFAVRSNLRDDKSSNGVATFKNGKLQVVYNLSPLSVESGIPHQLRVAFTLKTDPFLAHPVFVKSERKGTVLDRFEVTPEPGIVLHRSTMTNGGVLFSLWDRHLPGTYSQRSRPDSFSQDIVQALSLGERFTDGGGAILPFNFFIQKNRLPLKKGEVEISSPRFSGTANYDGVFLTLTANKEFLAHPAGVEKTVTVVLRTDPYLQTALIERIDAEIQISSCGVLLDPPSDMIWDGREARSPLSESSVRRERR